MKNKKVMLLEIYRAPSLDVIDIVSEQVVAWSWPEEPGNAPSNNSSRFSILEPTALESDSTELK